MKKSVITIMLSFIATVMMAQKTVVTGVLVDATLQEGEPYATVRIFKKGAQKPAAMCVTDLDGHFSQEIAGNGSYVVQMSSIGKVDTNREITLSGQTEIDLGHVEMKEDAQMLAGVEVVAQKPLVKMEVDKMSYNVQEDADSKAATVLDMLRKVPMVTVDGEDNISVNGSSSFKVYVDGKPNVMMSSAPSQVFKAMPASMVKNIEVITNPGAKYDAEGGAGVLNIVMNKEATAAMGGASSMNGYNGNIRVQAGTKSLGASAFVSGQQDKLTYSANVNYNRSNPGETTTTMEREQLGTMPSTLISESTSKPKTPFVMGNITLGYELDALSSIGLTAGITSFNMKSNSHSTNSYTGSMYGNGYSYGNTIDTKMKRTSFSGSLDYQRFFNQERTSSLTLAYQLTYAPTNNETTTLFDQLENSSWMDMTNRYSENKERTTDHIFQADFTTLIGKNTTLNAGMKFSYRKATSDADNYLMGEYSEALSSEYEYKNAILAGYAEFVSKFGKWSTKAGLRYEQTWQDVSYQLGNGNDFTTNYGNLVPSASLSYNFAPTSNIGLTYNMRISRPGITYMNPYVDRSNPTMISYGNPDLETEKSHNLGLVFNSFSSKLMLNVNLRHSFTSNAIEMYSFYDSNNVLNSTYDNTAKHNMTSLNIYVNYLLNKNTRIFLNGGVDYSDLRSEALDLSNSGWHANMMLGVQQTLPWDIKLSCYLITSTKSYNLQGWSSGFNMLTANLSKSFFNDKLTVSVMAMTGLGNGGSLAIESYTNSKDFTNHMNIKVPMQSISLSLTYNFGNTKKQYQQRRSRVESDYIEHQSDGETINNAQMGQQ
ncbi:MAG: TonB-dependent receptor [Prevotella sp.]|nr:TonB-dependent receptor [Prevotella sp.]